MSQLNAALIRARWRDPPPIKPKMTIYEFRSKKFEWLGDTLLVLTFGHFPMFVSHVAVFIGSSLQASKLLKGIPGGLR